MAEDYRSVRSFPSFKNFTGAVKWTEVKLPSNCSRVQVGSTGALWVSSDGTDNATVGTQGNTPKGFVVANNYLMFNIGRGSTRDSVIYVAAQSGTPNISIIMEE